MKFPLTPTLVAQAAQYNLRSACQHCFFFRTMPADGPQAAKQCVHGWPDEGQHRFPLDAPDPQTGEVPTDVAFCKEFELA